MVLNIEESRERVFLQGSGGGSVQGGPQGWSACCSTTQAAFATPVRVLSRLFRGLFLEPLETASSSGRLEFHGQLEHLSDRAAFRQLVERCRAVEWVVYAKPPFGASLSSPPPLLTSPFQISSKSPSGVPPAVRLRSFLQHAPARVDQIRAAPQDSWPSDR